MTLFIRYRIWHLFWSPAAWARSKRCNGRCPSTSRHRCYKLEKVNFDVIILENRQNFKILNIIHLSKTHFHTQVPSTDCLISKNWILIPCRENGWWYSLNSIFLKMSVNKKTISWSFNKKVLIFAGKYLIVKLFNHEIRLYANVSYLVKNNSNSILHRSVTDKILVELLICYGFCWTRFTDINIIHVLRKSITQPVLLKRSQ